MPETIIRIVIGLALLSAICLGFRMLTGNVGRGHLWSWRGFNIVRTVIAICLLPLLVRHVLFPQQDIPFLYDLSREWAVLGLLLLLLGMVVRVWAQLLLGKEWSADVSLLTDHRLVDVGPYRLFKHPIYTSYLLLAPGLFLCTQDVAVGLLALAYTLVSWLRSGKEETTLLEAFGGVYVNYTQAVEEKQRMLIAFFVIIINLAGITSEVLVIF